MDEGLRKWKKKRKKDGPKWLSDWDHENGSRQRMGSPKDGNKIKLRNEGTSKEKLVDWEKKTFAVKKWKEGMDTSFQTLIKTFRKVLKFSPGAACCFSLQLDPDGWLALRERRARNCGDSEEQQPGNYKNHWTAEMQPKIMSTYRSSNKDKTLKLILDYIIFICLNFFKVNMFSSLILISLAVIIM